MATGKGRAGRSRGKGEEGAVRAALKRLGTRLDGCQVASLTPMSRLGRTPCSLLLCPGVSSALRAGRTAPLGVRLLSLQAKATLSTFPSVRTATRSIS